MRARGLLRGPVLHPITRGEFLDQTPLVQAVDVHHHQVPFALARFPPDRDADFVDRHRLFGSVQGRQDLGGVGLGWLHLATDEGTRSSGAKGGPRSRRERKVEVTEPSLPWPVETECKVNLHASASRIGRLSPPRSRRPAPRAWSAPSGSPAIPRCPGTPGTSPRPSHGSRASRGRRWRRGRAAGSRGRRSGRGGRSDGRPGRGSRTDDSAAGRCVFC